MLFVRGGVTYNFLSDMEPLFYLSLFPSLLEIAAKQPMFFFFYLIYLLECIN